jgi:hypothetical protein
MSFGDQIEENETGKECVTYRGKINACRVLMRNPEGKRTLKVPSVDGSIT